MIIIVMVNDDDNDDGNNNDNDIKGGMVNERGCPTLAPGPRHSSGNTAALARPGPPILRPKK